jgi:ribosomal protein L11 methyltransferase
MDTDAIGNAEQNVRTNGVADRVVVIEGDAEALLPHVAPVRVVLANIISSVLISLLPAIRSALGRDGVAIFSGILREERDAFMSALANEGWRPDQEDIEDAWWTVVARPA